jgi:hypothetical protein
MLPQEAITKNPVETRSYVRERPAIAAEVTVRLWSQDELAERTWDQGIAAMESEKETWPADQERPYARLLSALRANSLIERQDAVKSLARLGHSAVEPLLTTLANDHELVAEDAAEALAAIGDAHVVAPLIDYCLRYRPTGGYRNDPHAGFEEQRRATDWLRPLGVLVERVQSTIVPEDLRRLASLEDQEFLLHVDYDTPGYGNGSDEFVVKLNFAAVRNLAAAEQRRRGKVVG